LEKKMLKTIVATRALGRNQGFGARSGWAMFCILGLGSSTAWSYEQALAHVTMVQSSYMPNVVVFRVDTGTASCPAGTWLLSGSTATTDNNKAAYSLLLAAINTGYMIEYGINAGDTSCTVVFLYELNGP
jgi:hypothetical protein